MISNNSFLTVVGINKPPLFIPCVSAADCTKVVSVVVMASPKALFSSSVNLLSGSFINFFAQAVLYSGLFNTCSNVLFSST